MEDKVYCGNNIDVLKTFPDNSVDSVVTDPPYELGFMGKKWDATGIAYSVELWTEILRVLKPGGHLLSFGGTRTYHRMTCAIEDAGFEIRDCIQWIYGSGFPKSLDISKAIDKKEGVKRDVVGSTKTGGFARVMTNNLEQGFRPNDYYSEKGNNFVSKIPVTDDAKQWEGWGTALKPAYEIVVIATKKIKLKSLLEDLGEKIRWQLILFVTVALKNLQLNHREQKEVADFAQCLVEREFNSLERLSEVMGMYPSRLMGDMNCNTVSLWLNTLIDVYSKVSMYTIEMETSLITDLRILNSLPWLNIQDYTIKVENILDGIQQFVSHASVIFSAVSMKLNYIQEHSVVETAIKEGSENDLPPNNEPIVVARKPLSEKTIIENVLKHGTGGINIDECRVGYSDNDDIRIGKNYKHNASAEYNPEIRKDNSTGDEVELYDNRGRFPSNVILDEEAGAILDEQTGILTSVNSGGASRFFYCAKASSNERSLGLKSLTPKVVSDGRLTENNTPFQRDTIERHNTHPTVKPIKLMEYLVKLVTPPDGIVLDPFAGSGTTLVASKQLGFKYVGIELNKEYVDIINLRLDAIKPIKSIFKRNKK